HRDQQDRKLTRDARHRRATLGEQGPGDDRDGRQLQEHVGWIAGRARAPEQKANAEEQRNDQRAEMKGHAPPKGAIWMRRTVTLSIFGNSVGSPTSFSHWAGQSVGTEKSPPSVLPAKVRLAIGTSASMTLSGRAQYTLQNSRCWGSCMSPSTRKARR